MVKRRKDICKDVEEYIKMAKSKIELIKEFISTCPFLENGIINVDYVDEIIEGFTIDIKPSDLIYKRYADGSSLRQIAFDFVVNAPFSNLQNLANSKFFEDFSKWIETQNKSNNLPVMPGVQSIECIKLGYILQKTDTVSNYIIEMQVIYFEGGN